MTPKIFIHDGYKKKDGTAAIYVLVHLAGKSLKFPTGVSCDPDQFDPGKQRIKGASRTVKDNNLIIEKSLATINDIAVRYRLQHVTLTPELLKREWKNPARRIDFYAFMTEAMKERRGEIAASSLKQHESLKAKLQEFRPALSFSEIDAEFINQFRRHLKLKLGNGQNTIHNNLKNFKTYLNIAKRKGVIQENPFDLVKFSRATTDRVFLSETELKVFQDRYNSGYYDKNYGLVLRHFLFMCYTGLRVSDLRSLTFDNIMDGKVVYWPVKTRNHKRAAVKVPLTRYAWQLIRDEANTDGLVFNCLSEQQMNIKIKELARDMKVYKDVTNHSGRHTFGTLYIQKTNDVAGLQKLLGHSKITETMIYVHITDTAINEQMKSFEQKLFSK